MEVDNKWSIKYKIWKIIEKGQKYCLKIKNIIYLWMHVVGMLEVYMPHATALIGAKRLQFDHKLS